MQDGWDRFRFDRLVSVAHHANRRSIRVMEKLGMAFAQQYVHKGIEVVQYAKANPARQGQREGAGE
jgi:RimJ/RimL family protein N-acetyltransferase